MVSVNFQARCEQKCYRDPGLDDGIEVTERNRSHDGAGEAEAGIEAQ